MEIEVHGLKAKFLFNQHEENLIPAFYLRKAARSLQRTAWIFRGIKDPRHANLDRWSKVDIRFRGVFKTLQKTPKFNKGLYEGDLETDLEGFGDAARAQGKVVYALLEDISQALDIRREANDERYYFHLRPRLFNMQLEYWTGHYERHKDTPYTAGVVCLEFKPGQHLMRAIVPISTTTDHSSSLESSLAGKFKLLLSQFLLNIHRLHPPGDKFPDQEVFLIGLHGSRLHVFRGIFPGHKTSRLWSGRHNPASSEESDASSVKEPAKPADQDRFYTKHNIERFLQHVEWQRLSTCDNEPGERVFRVLGSQEYDLWCPEGFGGALRILVALVMYLMSGRARCGILQDVFEKFPYDEEDEPESEEEEKDGKAKLAREEEEVVEQERMLEEEARLKREEDRERCWAREAMRGSAGDRIGGFRNFRKPWWDWVWEDKNDEGQAKDDADGILKGGP
ncbi:hypothetical protein FE257_002009 [Aspergillus nanangensis]|uniref:Uncharacterized protein n=1 Tax=Aspergillus nanangensis TaxID=2582783 RepID=A0AAD4CV22_ASPNN|nr:hypothetical protein FE257_002009 [Aspergillus nanangensis]